MSNWGNMGRMNASLSVGGQKIRFDRETTLQLYRENVTAPGADCCDCHYCKNFARQRDAIYPDEFKALLARLGADHLKELEAFELGPSDTESNLRVYGGWFLFCGELIEGPDVRPEGQPFSFWFTKSFPNTTLPYGLKTCAVEFLAEIPWVLSEPLV